MVPTKFVGIDGRGVEDGLSGIVNGHVATVKRRQHFRKPVLVNPDPHFVCAFERRFPFVVRLSNARGGFGRRPVDQGLLHAAMGEAEADVALVFGQGPLRTQAIRCEIDAGA